MSDQFLMIPRVVNSAIAGSIASTLVYPLDLIKTRFQTQSAGSHMQYTSIPNAFYKIRKHEGILGLYRGLAVNVSLVTPELIANIVGNDTFRYLFQPNNGKQSITSQTLAAGCTGLLTTCITSPMEFIKIQLQESGRVHLKTDSSPKLTGRDVVLHTIKQRGVFGLFHGIEVCAMRDVPFSIMYFPSFAFLYNLGPKQSNGETTYLWSLASGLLAGSISSVILTPFDVVKTRIQVLHAKNTEIGCRGVVHCFKKIYEREGYLAFFKGAGCRALVIAPLFGITEMIYYFGVAERLMGWPVQTFVR